jgi:hypothetical protein
MLLGIIILMKMTQHSDTQHYGAQQKATRIMTLNMTLGIITLSIMTLSIRSFSIMTLSITTRSMMTLSISKNKMQNSA